MPALLFLLATHVSAAPYGLLTTWSGEATGDQFGIAVAPAGDVDGDGFADLVIGAPFANPTAQLIDAGRVDLFASALAGPPTFSLWGEQQNEHFGLAVAAGFDWDGDGEGDLAVGATDYTLVDGTWVGRVAVHRGGAALDTVADTLLTGSTAGLHLGTSLAAGGDLTGNRRGILCAGGYNSADSGRVLLLSSGEPTVVAAPPAVAAGIYLLHAAGPAGMLTRQLTLVR